MSKTMSPESRVIEDFIRLKAIELIGDVDAQHQLHAQVPTDPSAGQLGALESPQYAIVAGELRARLGLTAELEASISPSSR